MSRPESNNRSRSRSGRSQATDRVASQRSANLRLIRTVILGTIAVGVAIIWLGDQYGIERVETIEYLTAAVLFVGGLAVLGLLGFGLLQIFRLFTRKRTPNAGHEKSDQP